jgi:hypothetical protein
MSFSLTSSKQYEDSIYSYSEFTYSMKGNNDYKYYNTSVDLSGDLKLFVP